MKKLIILTILLCSIYEWGCDDVLEVSPPGELEESIVLTPNGIKALLFSSYSGMQIPARRPVNMAELSTDIAYNTGGGENLSLSQIINFTWDASLDIAQSDLWAPYYRCVRDANLVLESLPAADISEDLRKLYQAEATFLRAYAYEFLYKWFGPVPLRTSSQSPTDLARATDEEMKSFIETELLASITGLPDPGAEEAFGRANKGMAWAALAKYYLNTKQWQKASDAASKVIGFNYYELFPEFEKMFTVANEGNKEMILVVQCLNVSGFGNWYQAGALPPNFKTSAQIPEYVWVPGISNFATQYRLRSAFVNSYDLVNDRRAILIIRNYTTTSGGTVNLMTTADNARCFKYWDNDAVGNEGGNDMPQIRYADILLTKAEALNELNGPSQEALDLINQVRKRAGILPLTLADATSTEVLRNLILRERAWDFVGEGKRREDFLRHGLFISSAVARGVKTASDKHKVFPIPQAEIDANKLCKQTDGY